MNNLQQMRSPRSQYLPGSGPPRVLRKGHADGHIEAPTSNRYGEPMPPRQDLYGQIQRGYDTESSGGYDRRVVRHTSPGYRMEQPYNDRNPQEQFKMLVY